MLGGAASKPRPLKRAATGRCGLKEPGWARIKTKNEVEGIGGGINAKGADGPSGVRVNKQARSKERERSTPSGAGWGTRKKSG